MKVYLAARYSRRLELVDYAEQMRERGYEITSRWLDGSHELADGATKQWQKQARRDLEDIDLADTVVCFTEPEGSGGRHGGRHVEAGYAMARGKRVVVVGPAENLFYTLPEIYHCSTWQLAFEYFVAGHRSLQSEATV